MNAPDIDSSTQEERMTFIKEEFRCKGNCEICGNCAFLRGKEAEVLYEEYIAGNRSFREITIEHRNESII